MLDLELTYFLARQAVTSAKNDDHQTLAKTYFFRKGDVLDLILVDDNTLCEVSVDTAGLTIDALCPNDALVLDAVIDTSAPPVGQTYYFINRTIERGQDLGERILSAMAQPHEYGWRDAWAVTGFALDAPVAGDATYDGSVSPTIFFMAGDTVDVIHDAGLAGSSTIISINNITKQIVLDDNIDLTGLTGVKFVNTSLTLYELIHRIKNSLDTGGSISEPKYNVNLGAGDGDNVVFATPDKYLKDTLRVYLDRVRAIEGTSGTLAQLVNGAGNAAVTFRSQIAGTNGNSVQIELVDPAAPSSPLSVSVATYGANKFPQFRVTVSLETDGGSTLVSTAQEVAEAINADAAAQLVMQALYGGDGTGVQAALTPTPLAGGLDDWTGDYWRIEAVVDNSFNGNDDYMFISYHVGSGNDQLLRKPPTPTQATIVD